MTPNRWKQVKSICEQVMDLPGRERTALLEKLCAGDANLSTEVESLLAADVADDFVAPPDTGRIDDAVRKALAAERVGKCVGAYRLTRVLGCGGMGDVYAADRIDGGFEQTVAIKMLRAGANTPWLLQRFLSERQTLAQLAHARIARLLDGGQLEDGQPYLIMEYVDGQPIDEYCRSRALDTDSRIDLFIQVCQAVEYAHQSLILHCDLKPANILVNADGSPKLLDFGIARWLESESATSAATTHVRQFWTPEYASPEQVRGNAASVATDVYSLGCVLYRILTDVPPLHLASRSTYDIARTIVECDPPRPSTVLRKAPANCAGSRRRARQIGGDLDTIVLRCLRKEPAERFPSVEQLRLELERYRACLPILSRPPTLSYQTGKFIRRNPLGCALGAAATIGILAMSGVAQYQAGTARLERDTAQSALREADKANRTITRVSELLRSLLAAPDPANARGNDVTVRELLDRASAGLSKELHDEPEVEASMRATIGLSYQGIGEYEAAEFEYRRALALRTEHFGPRHHETLSSVLDLGVIRYLQQDFSGAEAFLRDAVDGNLVLFGENHARTAGAMAALSATLRSQRRLDEAENLCRRALRIRETLNGRMTADFAESLNNLAALLGSRGDLEGMMSAAEEVLHIRMQVLGHDHPLSIQSLGNLGISQLRAGCVGEAEETLRLAITSCLRVTGMHHPSMATLAGALGRVLVMGSRPAEAEFYLRMALSGYERALPTGGRALAEAKYSLGVCLRDQGRFDEAEAELQSLIDEMDSHSDPTDLLSSVRVALNEVHRRRGELDRSASRRLPD